MSKELVYILVLEAIFIGLTCFFYQYKSVSCELIKIKSGICTHPPCTNNKCIHMYFMRGIVSINDESYGFTANCLDDSSECKNCRSEYIEDGIYRCLKKKDIYEIMMSNVMGYIYIAPLILSCIMGIPFICALIAFLVQKFRVVDEENIGLNTLTT